MQSSLASGIFAWVVHTTEPESIILMKFGILSAVFLEDAFVGPKQVFSEQRMFGALLQKPATERFLSFFVA